MAGDNLTLKPNQPTVTFTGIRYTELPFFNLSYNRRAKAPNVDFEYTDEEGNSNRWQVRYNRDSDIGYPGVTAHEVWNFLVKPMIDLMRKRQGRIPTIIPLGGVRESLRMVGWSEGGHQANALLRALEQISSAYIKYELWIPVNEPDAEGKRDYKRIRGAFNKLSVYAVGSYTNLSPEELKNVDIDLDDKIFIKLHQNEIKFLEDDKEKLLDNEQMFLSQPAGRRWFELLSNKVYGTVRHNAPFFDIKYSWLLKRIHPPLKHHHQKFRVVEQMNRVVKDFLADGYLTKVEYRKIKAASGEIDFRIRYYPGPGARKSINRIKGYLLNNERFKEGVNPKVKKAHVSPSIGQKTEKRPLDHHLQKGSPDGEVLASDAKPDNTPATFTKEHEDVMQILVTKFGISAKKAHKLTADDLQECQRQIAAMEFREGNTTNKAGFLITAIKEKWEVPEAMIEAEKAEKRRIAEEAKREKERLEYAKKQKIIDACSICPENGIRAVKSEFKMPGKTPRIVRGWHECTHDPEKEARFEDYYDEDDKSLSAGK